MTRKSVPDISYVLINFSYKAYAKPFITGIHIYFEFKTSNV